MKVLFIQSFFFLSIMEDTLPQVSNSQDLNVLLGNWKLDMTPQDKTDDNFASMNISKIEDNSFQGYFYRKGVKIREAQINTQTDILYAALISGDNSGTYNSTFYPG